MRRILLLLTGALALALAAPAVASAHGHHHHRHRHHHHRHAHHGRFERVNPADQGAADAGRVASFADGTLTITLVDGSTVSGKVTSDTVVNCIPAAQNPAPTAAAAHDGGWGDDDRGDRGDDDRGHRRGQAACTTADLVPGAIVHVAILKLGADGAEFKLVLLVKQQETS